jgi:solute carrier family 41
MPKDVSPGLLLAIEKVPNITSGLFNHQNQLDLTYPLLFSAGGFILEGMVEHFEGFAVYQPVINGVGGNLVAVHASRISTSLHRDFEPGMLDDEEGARGVCLTPGQSFLGKSLHARTSRVLLAMVIPGHLVFIFTIHYIKYNNVNMSPSFVIGYLIAAQLQVN